MIVDHSPGRDDQSTVRTKIDNVPHGPRSKTRPRLHPTPSQQMCLMRHQIKPPG